MAVTITARHMSISRLVKDYAEEKAGRMLKYFSRLNKIEAILDREGEKYTAEIIVTTSRGVRLVGHAREADALAAIDAAAARVERQVSRLKDKIKDRRGRGEKGAHEARPDAVESDRELD